MKKTYKIKVKLNGKQVKYAINDYMADELIKRHQITIKELPKFIQNNVIAPFKNDNYIVENGVKNTLDQMIFEYFMEMYQAILNNYKDQTDTAIIKIGNAYEKKLNYIDIKNDNTRKAHYEALAKIKKEYEAEKRSLAIFTNFTKEVIEENINLNLMKEIRKQEIKQLEEDWELMKINFSYILKQKAKEEQIREEHNAELREELALIVEQIEFMKERNTLEKKGLENKRKLKEALQKEIALLKKQKEALEKEVA